MVLGSRTVEGFPLPTIREWNRFATEAEGYIAEAGKDDPRPAVFKGAVDDLESPYCNHCGNEMIRQFKWIVGPFNAGIVYCHDSMYDNNHPMEYWLEMWPYAGAKRRPLFGSDMSIEESNEGFRLSNPIIKRCYTGAGIDWHQHMSLEDFSPGGRTTTLPKPNYVHK